MSIRCAKRRIFTVDIMHLFYAVTYKLKMTASLNTDLPCDLPCAASLAGIQPVRPRAQRTSP